MLLLTDPHHSRVETRVMMKSIVYGAKNEPVSKETRRPSVNKRHQVLIRIHAVGLNPVDAKGVVGDKLPHSWTTFSDRISV